LGYSAMLRDKLLGDLNPAQENALDKVIGHTNDLCHCLPCSTDRIEIS